MNFLWRTWIFCAICLYTTTFLSAEAQSVAPYFTLTPGNKTALLHTSIRLDCQANGVPTPTIKWVKYSDSGGETAIQTGGRFIVGTVSVGYLYVLQIHWSDAGRYGCIAQNEHGRVETDAHIFVITDSAPSWDTKPHNVTLYEGQQYTLPCKAHGYPLPTYFWSHKGSVIIDLDVKVLSNNYLYFSSAKLRHSGWYTCTVSNFYGTISYSVYVDVVSDPSIVIHPEDVPIVRGGKITMSCGVVGSATVRVKWIQNDSNLPDDTLISFTNQTWRNVKIHTLNIKKARRRHLGVYHCLVQNAMGSVKSRTAKVYFSEFIPPLQIEVPMPTVTVSVGSDVELRCVFIGRPTPQVTWYKDGKQVIDIGTAVIRPVNTRSEAILKLSSVTQLLSGHYVCIGDAGRAGTAKGNISLVVKGGSVPGITPLNQYKETKKDSNTTLQFFVMGTVEPDITWYKDGKQLENFGSTRLHANGTYSVELQITSAQYSDSGLYTCTAENQFGTSSANVTLAVKGIPEPPVNVTVKHTSPNTVLVSWVPGYNGGANCTFSVQFKRSGATAWTSSDGILENATSAVLSNKEGWNGQFVFRVTAVNQFGSFESSEVPVTLGSNAVPQERSDKDSSVGAVVGGVIGGVLAILLLIVVVLIMCRKKKTKGPPKPLPSVLYSVVEQEQYAYADPNANQSTQERCDTYSYVTVRPDATIAMAVGGNGEYTSIPRPKQWEVPKRNVRLDKKLGSGHFGMVMKGFLKTKQGTQVVAVKMLKENADQQQKKEFLAELELMKAMAPHPNIVGLVGCCTKSDHPFIIVEYCSLGNLMDFLRSSHGSVVYANMAGNSLTLTNRDLLSFAWQCARGMSYLASQKLVHRDLAARNVLVDTGNVCKIADFGLARDIYEKKLYLKKGEGELPLRWMAIESIFKGITTTESDVWSYGVLLWEIVTLGANPYPGMNRDQLIDQLRNGYRMPKPQYCSDELYAIMWQCWQQDPESRPTFLELGKTLHRLMTAQKISIDLDNFDVSYINAPEEQ